MLSQTRKKIKVLKIRTPIQRKYALNVGDLAILLTYAIRSTITATIINFTENHLKSIML